MTDSFGASYLKIERARRHLRELEAVIQQYIESKPAEFTSHVEGRTVFLNITKVQPVPIETSAIAGDIFHNLRSALDLMASELCGSYGQPADDAHFPFCSDASELDGMIKRRKFDRAGDAAVNLLKEWKPHIGGNTTLRAIHDLNIRDKHRTLIVHPVGFGSPIIDTQAPDGGLTVLGDGTSPSSVELTFPADSALTGRDLLKTMHELVELTAAIVKSFAALPRAAE